MTKQNEVKKLQKEEEKVYKKICKLIKVLKPKEQQKFFSLLAEEIDFQIELEKLCSQ